jgi:hypothetical protein
MIDLLAVAAVELETEVTYIRRERDWLDRAIAEGRMLQPGRLLPVLPASVARPGNGHDGNGHDGGGHGSAHGDPGHAHSK